MQTNVFAAFDRNGADASDDTDALGFCDLSRRPAPTLMSADGVAVLQALADSATRLSGAEFGAFFGDIRHGDGPVACVLLAGKTPPGLEGLASVVKTAVGNTRNGRPAGLRCDDLFAKGREPAEFDRCLRDAGLQIRSYLAFPVGFSQQEVSGALFVAHTEPSAFTASASRLLVLLSAQASLAIDNARLVSHATKADAEREALREDVKAARAEIDRVSAVNDDFLATLSHELRTPLSSILGWSQVLRRKAPLEGDYSRGLEAIERNARMQALLIEELLDMSRVTSGKVLLDPHAISPVSFIEAALETVAPQADAKRIALERELDPYAGAVWGDRNRLQQVAVNLLSNAIKFTPRNGTVRVTLKREASRVTFTVVDNGIGIPAGLLPHLFEPFGHVNASIPRQFGGLGLGLSITRHLVELHGGTIDVRSEGEGRGTSATVCLPLAPPNGRRRGAVAAGETGPPLANLSAVKVLVVDDHADAREVVKALLESCSAEVVTASNAEEAIDLLVRLRPALLISDIGMPNADGFELLRRIRAMPAEQGGNVPAIALSALTRTADRTRALQAGFLVHVSKPIEAAELVATVASITGRLPR